MNSRSTFAFSCRRIGAGLSVLLMGAALSLLLVVFSAPVGAQNGAMDLETRRQVEALTEQIRILHSEGRYEDVIRTADQLLALDPGNTAAELWSSRARRRLDGAPVTVDRLIELREPDPRGRAAVADEFDTSEMLEDIAPVPLEPRQRQATTTLSVGTGLPNWMLAVIVGVAVLLIVLATVVVIRMRKSQQVSSDMMTEPATQHAGGTNVYDAVTQVGGDPKPVRDEDSVMQFGAVGKTTRQGDDDTQGQTPQPPPIEKRKAESSKESKGVSLNEEDTNLIEPEEIPTAPSIDFESDSIDLGFGGSNEEEEKKEASFNSLLFTDDGEDTSVPTEPPQKPAPSAQETEEDDGDLTFNSMMFSDDADETNVVGGEKTSKKEPSQPPPSEDDADLTFNSLMFGDSDETQLPGSDTTNIPSKPPPEKSSPPPTEQDDEGDLTFNSMMFGGQDTALPDPETKVGDNEPEFGETINLTPGLSDDPDATNVIGGGQASGAERFEHQKSTGLQALQAGDYKLAVQSLTLAQAIKPDDKEVAEKLTEAKKLRDQ